MLTKAYLKEIELIQVVIFVGKEDCKRITFREVFLAVIVGLPEGRENGRADMLLGSFDYAHEEDLEGRKIICDF